MPDEVANALTPEQVAETIEESTNSELAKALAESTEEERTAALNPKKEPGRIKSRLDLAMEAEAKKLQAQYKRNEGQIATIVIQDRKDGTLTVEGMFDPPIDETAGPITSSAILIATQVIETIKMIAAGDSYIVSEEELSAKNAQIDLGKLDLGAEKSPTDHILDPETGLAAMPELADPLAASKAALLSGQQKLNTRQIHRHNLRND